MRHYPLHELDRYRSGKMSFAGRCLCRLHLVFCRRCRGRLTRLAEDEMLLEDVRKSVRNMSVADNEATYRKLCESFHEVPGTSR